MSRRLGKSLCDRSSFGGYVLFLSSALLQNVSASYHVTEPIIVSFRFNPHCDIALLQEDEYV